MNLQELKKLETRLSEPISIPVIGRCLQKKAVTALAEDNSPDALKVLVKAIALTKNEDIKEIILDALSKLENRNSIDAFCQVWADTRHKDLTKLLVKKSWVASAPIDIRVLRDKFLEQIVCKGKYIAQQPIDLKVLTALKADRLEVIGECGKEVVGRSSSSLS